MIGPRASRPRPLALATVALKIPGTRRAMREYVVAQKDTPSTLPLTATDSDFRYPIPSSAYGYGFRLPVSDPELRAPGVEYGLRFRLRVPISAV